MSAIIYTYNPTTSTPHLYKLDPGGTTATEVTISDVTGMNVRPSFERYRGRVYMGGSYSRPLVFTEAGGITTMGIRPPTNAATLATSGTGITGSAIGSLTFAQKVNDSNLIMESDFSAASNTLALTNQGRAWSGIPTTAPDKRVTHVRGYVSMDGATERLAWEQLFGIATTITENVPTASLGPTLASAGSRGVPPYTKYIKAFHDRMWFAGDPSNPHRLYYSELNTPEAVGASSSIDTRDGEVITGIGSYKDTLVIFCRHSIYTLQGFTEDDFELTRASPTIGCISHHSIVNIHDRLWFASEDGVHIFDGAPMFVMESLRDYFVTDYAANKSAYEDSVGALNRTKQRYELLIQKPSATQKTFVYMGNFAGFDPSASSGGEQTAQPVWTFKVRTRQDTTLCNIPIAGGTLLDTFCAGSTDGFLRQEDVATNVNDDSDTYNKKLIIRHGHLLYNDPGGGRTHGKALVDLDMYMVSEDNAWTLNVWPGDEDASTALTAAFTASPVASLSATHAAKSVHHFRPTLCSGRGFTIEITATSHKNMEYRGLGGSWKPSIATRPKKA